MSAFGYERTFIYTLNYVCFAPSLISPLQHQDGAGQRQCHRVGEDQRQAAAVGKTNIPVPVFESPLVAMNRPSVLAKTGVRSWVQRIFYRARRRPKQLPNFSRPALG